MFVPSLMADMRVTFCSESFWRSFRPPFAGDIKARLLIPHLDIYSRVYVLVERAGLHYVAGFLLRCSLIIQTICRLSPAVELVTKQRWSEWRPVCTCAGTWFTGCHRWAACKHRQALVGHHKIQENVGLNKSQHASIIYNDMWPSAHGPIWGGGSEFKPPKWIRSRYKGLRMHKNTPDQWRPCMKSQPPPFFWLHPCLDPSRPSMIWQGQVIHHSFPFEWVLGDYVI